MRGQVLDGQGKKQVWRIRSFMITMGCQHCGANSQVYNTNESKSPDAQMTD